jgi:hypothetical protein
VEEYFSEPSSEWPKQLESFSSDSRAVYKERTTKKAIVLPNGHEKKSSAGRKDKAKMKQRKIAQSPPERDLN